MVDPFVLRMLTTLVFSFVLFVALFYPEFKVLTNCVLLICIALLIFLPLKY